MRGVQRSLKRRFGITAPRLSVRTHFAWYWRWIFLGIVALLALLFARQIFDAGMRVAGFARSEVKDELLNLRESVARLQKENTQLRAATVAGERQLQIDRAAQGDLAKSLKLLQDENTKMKEDLAFLQSMMSNGRGQETVSIHRLKIEHGGLPGEYRYRLLVVQQGNRERDFHGRVQLLVNIVRGEQKNVLLLPVPNSDMAAAFQLSFKIYQRVEGNFQVPPGAVVKSVQARIYTNGAAQPKLVQSVNVS